MADRVSEIATRTVHGVTKYPNECLIGMAEIARMFGHPGFVELKDRLGRLAADPLRLCVAQRVLIELRSSLLAMTPREREIMNFFHFGQPRTGWIHSNQLPIRH